MAAFRLDDVIRTERYYTATLLPAVLLHDDFAGLRQFVRLLDEGGSYQRSPEKMRILRPSPETALPKPLSAHVELVTEFYIRRDLTLAGHILVEADDDRKDVPDLVLIIGDEAIVCEAKCFGAWTRGGLTTQLRSQQRELKFLFEARPDLRCYRHVVILPWLVDLDDDADVVLTWRDITALSAQVRAPAWVKDRLKSGAERMAELQGDPTKRNWTGRLPLPELVEVIRLRRLEGLRTQVGYLPGHQRLPHDTGLTRSDRFWKWRDPDNNLGKPDPRHWVSGEVFLSVVEPIMAKDTKVDRRESQPPPKVTERAQ